MRTRYGHPFALIALILVALTVADPAGVAHAQPAADHTLVVETPISAFVVNSVLKEFSQFAKEKWNVVLKTATMRAGTPTLYDRTVAWKGHPEADVFWGGEPALFDKLAAQKLLAGLDVSPEVWDSIPASIGTPKAVPLKDPARFWVGTALEVYGLVYHPRLLRQLGVPEPRDWEDVLNPRLKGQIVQSKPTRSSSSHATYVIVLQTKGETEGWEWLKRLAANTGAFVDSSRAVPAAVAKGEFAIGFAVPSYYAFEEKLSGFDIKFVAPKNAFVTPEPVAVLAGARNSRFAREFVAFLLSERGQRVLTERGLFPITPRYKVRGAPGSTAELVVELTGGIRSFFDAPVSNVYDGEVARSQYQAINERFRLDIEAAWDDLKRKY
ncbi:MAG TPA: extracellular solute-binding protein [Terriglobales bacterium]|nr:extracellular solute-binding protein [Terriglobales bacterium]